MYCLVTAPPGRTYVEIKDLSPGLQQGPSEETYKIISVSNSALQPINRVVDLVVKIIGEKFELWKDSADTKILFGMMRDFSTRHPREFLQPGAFIVKAGIFILETNLQ